MLLYCSFVALYRMKRLKNIQIIRIIRIIFRYSNIRIMIFKLWILFIIRFGNFLPTNIIRLFDSFKNDYSWQHWAWHLTLVQQLYIIHCAGNYYLHLCIQHGARKSQHQSAQRWHGAGQWLGDRHCPAARVTSTWLAAFYTCALLMLPAWPLASP